MYFALMISFNPLFKRSSGVLLLFFLLPVVTCIDRSNPWDPLNGCPEILRDELRRISAPGIDSALTRIISLDSSANLYKTIFDSIKKWNQNVYTDNWKIIRRADSIRTQNNLLDSINASNDDCTLAGLKELFDTLQYVDQFGDTENLHDLRTSISMDSSRCSAAIDAANQECIPQGVFGAVFIDSVFSIVNNITDSWDSILAEITAYHQSIIDSNQIIAEFNRTVLKENDSSLAYNERTEKLFEYCKKERFSNPETLQVLIPALIPGDTLYLDSGKITFPFRFTHKGTNRDEPIVIIGSPFQNTYIEPADFFISESQNIRFYNLTFAHGVVCGVKLESDCDNIIFDNCVFRDNNQLGLEIIESSVELRNCKIYHNLGSGIRIQGVQHVENRLVADNILVAHNKGYGILSVSASMLITNATISDNSFDGIRLEVANRTAAIIRSLITFNAYGGLRRDNSELGLGFFTTPNSNFFGNGSSAMIADSMYIKLNIPYLSEDPAYTDRFSDNYTIGASSPLFGTVIGYKE